MEINWPHPAFQADVSLTPKLTNRERGGKNQPNKKSTALTNLVSKIKRHYEHVLSNRVQDKRGCHDLVGGVPTQQRFMIRKSGNAIYHGVGF